MSHEGHEGCEAHEGLSRSLLALSGVVVDAAVKVHRALGPGLLESAYEQCLAHELGLRAVAVRRQVILPVTYAGMTLDAAYRLDLLVDERIIVEVKAVDALTRLHEAQALTYLRISGKRMALLMNFNVVLMKHGLRRVVL